MGSGWVRADPDHLGVGVGACAAVAGAWSGLEPLFALGIIAMAIAAGAGMARRLADVPTIRRALLIALVAASTLALARSALGGRSALVVASALLVGAGLVRVVLVITPLPARDERFDASIVAGGWAVATWVLLAGPRSSGGALAAPPGPWVALWLTSTLLVGTAALVRMTTRRRCWPCWMLAAAALALAVSMLLDGSTASPTALTLLVLALALLGLAGLRDDLPEWWSGGPEPDELAWRPRGVLLGVATVGSIFLTVLHAKLATPAFAVTCLLVGTLLATFTVRVWLLVAQDPERSVNPVFEVNRALHRRQRLAATARGNLGEVLRVHLPRTSAALDADTVVIALRSPDSTSWKLISGDGAPAGESARLPEALDAATKQPQGSVVPSAALDAEALDHANLRGLYAPIVVDGEVRGALGIERRERDWTFGERQIVADLASTFEAVLNDEQVVRRTLALAAAAERHAVAQDLHDSVLQELAMLGLDLDKVTGELEHTSAERVHEVRLRLGGATRELREHLTRLRGASLGSRTLPEALHDLECTHRRHERPPIRLLRVSRAPVDPYLADQVWLVVLEAVANATRHARPTAIDVSWTIAAGIARLEIANDGAAGSEPGLGLGLGRAGMAQRISNLGGELTSEPLAPDRWMTVATVPLEQVLRSELQHGPPQTSTARR
jgi:signal transduction histidine kinase